MTTGIELIKKERERQIEKEGWTQEHDAEHCFGELANAAACYAMTDFYKNRDMMSVECEDGTTRHVPVMWPWDGKWWKPTPNDRIKELTKAGALIAAEIDRLLEEKDKENQKNKDELAKKVSKPQEMSAKQYDIMLNHLQQQIDKNGVRKDQITS